MFYFRCHFLKILITILKKAVLFKEKSKNAIKEFIKFLDLLMPKLNYFTRKKKNQNSISKWINTKIILLIIIIGEKFSDWNKTYFQSSLFVFHH